MGGNKMTDYSTEDRAKLRAFFDAMDNLEGVLIPYNLICNHLAPLRKWLVGELNIEEDSQ